MGILMALWLVGLLFQSWQISVSILLGGLSYIVPTGIALLVLNFLRSYPSMAGKGFLLSEGLKIVLALVLMALSVLLYDALNFLAYLLALLAVSHLAFLLSFRIKGLSLWQVK